MLLNNEASKPLCPPLTNPIIKKILEALANGHAMSHDLLPILVNHALTV